MNSSKVFEQIYSQINHFFLIEGENHATGKSDFSSDRPVSNQNCLEWDLNQKYLDIATKDLTVLFNRFTPLFLRKFIVVLNQFLLFYFLTDQDLESPDQNIDNHHIIDLKFNYRFISYIHPVRVKIIKSQCFARFIHSLDKILWRLYTVVNDKNHATGIRSGRNYNYPAFERISKASCHRIANSGAAILMTENLFHKRN